jgi:hypothetical protein
MGDLFFLKKKIEQITGICLVLKTTPTLNGRFVLFKKKN